MAAGREVHDDPIRGLWRQPALAVDVDLRVHRLGAHDDATEARVGRRHRWLV